MRTIAIHTIIAVAGAAVLSGCQGDDGKAVCDRLIDFVPMAITRATQTETEDVTMYGVSSSIYPAANTFTTARCGSYWFNQGVAAADGRSGHYWPGSEYRVSFFAYVPYGHAALSPSSADDTGFPVYDYTVPSIIGNQADFMTADVTDCPGTASLEPVALTFHHRLADCRFLVYNQSTTAITIHSITVKGVKYRGSFCGGTWDLNATVNSAAVNPFTLTLGEEVSGKTTVDMTGTENHFMMLPQSVTTGTEIFDVDATVSGVRKHFLHTLTETMTLLEGKVYTITLTLGEEEMTVDTSTEITDWEEETKYISVSSVGSDNSWNQPSVSSGTGINAEDWEEEE